MIKDGAAWAEKMMTIESGAAFYMGDGRFVIDQREEDSGERHCAMVTEGDLERMLRPETGAWDISLEDGVASYVGDDLWVIQQQDPWRLSWAGFNGSSRPVVNLGDIKGMLELIA